MAAESGFFLSPFLIRELAKWRQSTGENIAVFEPVVRSCTTAGKALTESNDSAKEIADSLLIWCASLEFEALVLSCDKTRRNLWLEEATGHFQKVMKLDSDPVQTEIHGVSIERILCALSALLRAELRIWDSRSSGRMDELFVWQRQFDTVTAEDFALWLLCHLLEGTGANVFDKLTGLRQTGAEFKVAPVPDEDIQLRPALVSGVGHAAFFHYQEAADVFKRARAIPSANSAYGLLGSALTAFLNGAHGAAQRLLMTEVDSAPDIMHAVRILIFGASVVSPDIEGSFSNRTASPAIDQMQHVCDELCAQALAFANIQKREFKRAEEILSAYLKNNSCLSADSLFTYLLLAESILTPTCEVFFDDPPLPGSPGLEYPERLKLAQEYLNKAEALCLHEGMMRGANRVRVNLSCVLILRRKFERALQVLNTVLSTEPDNVSAVLNQASTLLLLGLLPRLYDCVEPLRNWDALIAGRMVADACYHTGDFEEALRLWNQLLEHERDRKWQMRAIIRELEIFRMLRNQTDAQSCTDALMQHFRSEPEALFALGCELSHIGEREKSIELLEAAKQAAAPNLKKWIAWELARIYCEQEKMLSATDEYAVTADKNVDSPQAREFIVALYRAGLLPAAYERAVALRHAGGGIIPGITEIEVDFLMQNDEPAKARDLLLELARLRPLSITNRIALIQLYLELGELANARRELDDINVSRLSDDLITQLLHLEERQETLASESTAPRSNA